MHWVKGSPLPKSMPGLQWGSGYDDKYDRLTFWEQLDGGQQYTLNKKFLTIVPIVLCVFAPSDCAKLTQLVTSPAISQVPVYDFGLWRPARAVRIQIQHWRCVPGRQPDWSGAEWHGW